jgi:hypothetical protein
MLIWALHAKLKIREINITDSRLVFDTDTNNWCQVNLHYNGGLIMLGSDNWDVIREKLSSALSSICESEAPEWVLSLSEKHCSFYRQQVNGRVEYFWKDSNGDEIWRSDVKTPLSYNELGVFYENTNV